MEILWFVAQVPPNNQSHFIKSRLEMVSFIQYLPSNYSDLNQENSTVLDSILPAKKEL